MVLSLAKICALYFMSFGGLCCMWLVTVTGTARYVHQQMTRSVCRASYDLQSMSMNGTNIDRHSLL